MERADTPREQVGQTIAFRGLSKRDAMTDEHDRRQKAIVCPTSLARLRCIRVYRGQATKLRISMEVSCRASPYRITRWSPSRRVTCVRSRYSSRGMAYLREMPVHCLNSGTLKRAGRRSANRLRSFSIAE